MHRFETLTFTGPTQRPPTLVVGNSGVFEDTGPPTGAFAQTQDGATATGFSLAQFGYLELARSKDRRRLAGQGAGRRSRGAGRSPTSCLAGSGELPLHVQGRPCLGAL